MNFLSMTKGLIATAVFASTVSGVANAHGNEKRMRVPDYVSCDRNEVTSYMGKVKHYSRTDELLSITVDTDFGTVYKLELAGLSEQEVIDLFKLNGKPFKAQDFPLLEDNLGVVDKRTTVAIWECSTPGVKPIVSWKQHQK